MKYLNTKDGSIEKSVIDTVNKDVKFEQQEIKFSEPKNYLGVKENSLTSTVTKVVSEETEYQKMFKKELEKAGKGIGAMTPAEKKAFFNKIDTKYKAKNENVSQKEIDKFHTSLDKLVHKSFGHSSDEKKKETKKEAVDNPYAVGMAQAMKSTGDKPPLKKSTITKAHDIAKSIAKDEKNEEKDVPKGYHKMPDGTVMKDSEHKNETHTFMTKDMNKSRKDAKGEKEIVDPEPKMKFKEAYKKVKEVSALKDEDKTNDPDVKKPKGKTDIGTNPTPVDTTPEVDYKH